LWTLTHRAHGVSGAGASTKPWWHGSASPRTAATPGSSRAGDVSCAGPGVG
jgi:hypothetical protein